jgi:uncharacterized integral membrane protein
MKIISGIIGFALLVLAVSFALSNRQSAVISLWPFGSEIEAPLYLLSLGTLFVGVLLGAVLGWVSMFPHRMQAMRLHKDVAALNQRLENLQQTIIVPSKPNMSFVGLDRSAKSKWRFWGPGL